MSFPLGGLSRLLDSLVCPFPSLATLVTLGFHVPISQHTEWRMSSFSTKL